MSDTAVAVSPRDSTVVESDLTIVQRHLRRKIQVQWSDEDPFVGQFRVGKFIWNCQLSYQKKYDFYRFRMEYKQDHSDLIARRFDIINHGAYPLVNDILAVHSTLRLLSTLDLEQD